MLCVLAGGVLAANTAFAAEYTETISGANDSYGTGVKSSDGNGNYTYNFGENDKLDINDDSYGIYLNYSEPNSTNKIIINNKLDISVTNKNNANATYGLYLQSNGDKEIDRSGGGNINVLVDGSELSAFAMGSGVYLTAPSDSDNNVIKIGNTDIDVQVLNAKHGIEAYGLTSSGTGDNNKIIMGNGSINITANSVSEDSSGSDSVAASGIAAYDNTEIETGNVAIVVTATGNENIKEIIANGIAADGGGIIDTGYGDVIVNAINVEGKPVYANGVFTFDGQVDKDGGKITVTAQGEGELEARAVYADGGIINLGVAEVTSKAIGGSGNNIKSNKIFMVFSLYIILLLILLPSGMFNRSGSIIS